MQSKLRFYNKVRCFILILIVFFFDSQAQNTFQWPAKGYNTGECIIYRPQDLIGNELNFETLFLSFDASTEIVAPQSGEILGTYYCYYNNLKYCFMKPLIFNEKQFNFDLYIQEKEDWSENLKCDPKYISMCVRVKTENGQVYTIYGLEPITCLNSGMHIKKGQILGKTGYSYHKIIEPSIAFSLSNSSGKKNDPMCVFGIKSTFVPYVKQSPINYQKHMHQPDKLLDDYDVFCAALIEGHPGLYDFVCKEKLDTKMADVREELLQPMTSEIFRLKLTEIIALIKDSHTAIYPNLYKTNSKLKPSVLFGLKEDSLKIYSSIAKYKEFIGKCIVKVDSFTLKEINPKIRMLVYQNDGYIQSVSNRKLLLHFWKYYSWLSQKSENDSVCLTFIDDTKLCVPYSDYSNTEYIPNILDKPVDSININTKTFGNKIGYVKIGSFALNDVEQMEIKSFIQTICDSSYNGLIIDVRDNFGGDDGILNDIYSYISQEPWKQTIKYKVNKKNYRFFEHSTSHASFVSYFEDYAFNVNDSTFIIPNCSIPFHYPDDSINYKGKLVVLANEFSLSAATLLPALVKKYHRGVIVGRETGSAYHHMNGLQFPKVPLKNTGLELFFPLVQVTFDNPDSGINPRGRGVIPDFNIPISYTEFNSKQDFFIEKAKMLILQDQKVEIQRFNSKFMTILFVLILSIICSVLLFVRSKAKQSAKHNKLCK